MVGGHADTTPSCRGRSHHPASRRDAAKPQKSARRAWPEESCQWAAGKRQLIEGVIWQLKDYFGLERHRAKTMGGLLTRLAAKVTAYTCDQLLNSRLGRPLRNFAELLV